MSVPPQKKPKKAKSVSVNNNANNNNNGMMGGSMNGMPSKIILQLLIDLCAIVEMLTEIFAFSCVFVVVGGGAMMPTAPGGDGLW
jgi:hypothetical protein